MRVEGLVRHPLFGGNPCSRRPWEGRRCFCGRALSSSIIRDIQFVPSGRRRREKLGGDCKPLLAPHKFLASDLNPSAIKICKQALVNIIHPKE